MSRVVMKPEGSRKVCVLNGSRQLDKVINGEWVTLKVLPEAGLPKGIYQLSEATKPPISRDPVTYTGPLLQVDFERVYQLHAGGIAVHNRAAFLDLENGGGKLTEGLRVSVTYQHGRAVAVPEGKAPQQSATPKRRSRGVEL